VVIVTSQHNIQQAVVIDVLDHQSVGTIACWNIDRSLEGSVPVSINNGDGIATVVGDHKIHVSVVIEIGRSQPVWIASGADIEQPLLNRRAQGPVSLIDPDANRTSVIAACCNIEPSVTVEVC